MLIHSNLGVRESFSIRTYNFTPVKPSFLLSLSFLMYIFLINVCYTHLQRLNKSLDDLRNMRMKGNNENIKSVSSYTDKSMFALFLFVVFVFFNCFGKRLNTIKANIIHVEVLTF